MGPKCCAEPWQPGNNHSVSELTASAPSQACRPRTSLTACLQSGAPDQCQARKTTHAPSPGRSVGFLVWRVEARHDKPAEAAADVVISCSVLRLTERKQATTPDKPPDTHQPTIHVLTCHVQVCCTPPNDIRMLLLLLACYKIPLSPP